MPTHIHRATIHWDQPPGDFLKGKYSREHTWAFNKTAVAISPASDHPR